MATDDPFSIQQITSIAESTSSILDSSDPIPPEVRHYLTLLRHLCGDVHKLHDLRERRIEYLHAAPHDLSEANGILAVSMLGAAGFEPILSKYQPTHRPKATDDLREATTRSEATVWQPMDVQELCKMAENLPFQREAIGATIGKLEEGSSQKNEVKGTRKGVVQPTSSSRISNVHLLNSLFGSTANMSTRDLQRSDSLASSIVVIETAARVVVSKQEKPALVSVQSSPRDSRGSFASSRTSGTHSATFLEEFPGVGEEKARIPKPLENGQRGVSTRPNSAGVGIFTKQPDRKIGLQALFSAPVPLTGGSLYSPPTTTCPPATTSSITSPDAKALDRSGSTVSQPPKTMQSHVRPTPQLVTQSSTHSHNAVPDSTRRSSQDEGSLHSLEQEAKEVVGIFSSRRPFSQPPPMHFPPPTPIQTRHTISEMTTLPEVVVEEPVWWAQRQRQQQQSREHLPTRTPSTQARYASAKAAELQRMFAPVATLKPSDPDISHVRAAAAAGFSRPLQSGGGSGGHVARSKQRHYSSPSVMMQYNRARSQSQTTPPARMMFYELDSCTTLDSVSSITSNRHPAVQSTGDGDQTRNRVDSISSRDSNSVSSTSIYSPAPIHDSDVNEAKASVAPVVETEERPQRSSVDEGSIVRTVSEHFPSGERGAEVNGKRQSDGVHDPCITPTPSVFRRSRNRTDSGAWVRRTQIFRGEK